MRSVKLMSNRATIQRTVFQNYGDIQETYGYRAYDDYGQAYGNCFEKADLDASDEDFIRQVNAQSDETVGAILCHCLEFEQGIYIDGDWKEFDWLKKTLATEEETSNIPV